MIGKDGKVVVIKQGGTVRGKQSAYYQFKVEQRKRRRKKGEEN